MLDHEKRWNVLTHRTDRVARGFSVLELMITIAVIAILAVLGMPTMAGAISNAKVRSATEALQNGLRNAQAEAIRRSHQTAFVLTNAAPALSAAAIDNGKNWYIQVLPVVASETVDNTFYVQGGSFGSETSGVTIRGPAAICFNSMGRVVANASPGLGAGVTCSAPAPMITYDVTKISGADRTLELQLGANGKIRMCDKSRSITTQPDGC